MWFYAAALLFLIGAIINYITSRTAIFTRLGINGPPKHWFFGHLYQLYHNENVSFHEIIQRWTKEYGKVYGIYEGAWPLLVISDLEMIEEIFVKQFRRFSSRNNRPLTPDADSDQPVHMFLANGLRWKRLRTICNPSFTAAKMKQMSSTMNETTDTLMAILEQKCNDGKAFDIYRVYGGFTLDTIGRCGFSLKSDCQRNDDDDFLILNRKVFTTPRNSSYFLTFAFLFPELNSILRKILFSAPAQKLIQSPFPILISKIGQIVECRRKNKSVLPSGQTDFVQLMLESEMPSDGQQQQQNVSNAESAAAADFDIFSQKIERKLVAEEIVGQSLLFILAGYETTSTTLAYCTYLLATDTKVQQRLQEEIDQFFPDANKILPSYESVSKLPYLEMVLSETMRLYPLASSVIGRKASMGCEIKGVKIPADLSIVVDVWSIHRSKDIWGDDADEFRPERFTPELRASLPSMAYLPFGAGPRICLGMRFAVMEAKIALCRILKQYTFKRCAETEVPLKVYQIQTVIPVNGVFIKLEKR